MKKVFIFFLTIFALASCANGYSTTIGDGLTFAWHNSLDYTNIYRGEGTEPVIPGGCDSAKWNNEYVLTKGSYWRYRGSSAWHITPAPADSLVYFVVDKKRYAGRQELDPALQGPLTPAQRVAWEQRIPGNYRVPE